MSTPVDIARPLRIRHWVHGPEADQLTIRLTRTPGEGEVTAAIGAFSRALEPVLVVTEAAAEGLANGAGPAEVQLRLGWATETLRLICARPADVEALAQAGLDLATADEDAIRAAGNDDALQALTAARQPTRDTAAEELRTFIASPEVGEVLRWMCFQVIPIVRVLRASGVEINKRAEDEQEAVMRWMLGHVAASGLDWKKAADVDLNARRAALRPTDPERRGGEEGGA